MFAALWWIARAPSGPTTHQLRSSISFISLHPSSILHLSHFISPSIIIISLSTRDHRERWRSISGVGFFHPRLLHRWSAFLVGGFSSFRQAAGEMGCRGHDSLRSDVVRTYSHVLDRLCMLVGRPSLRGRG